MMSVRTLIAALVATSATGPALSQEAPDRIIVVVSNEIRVTRSVDKTPYPDTLERYPDLLAGGGYALTPPDENNEWYARVYQWSPGVIHVIEGERVRLEFFGINGDLHPTHIEGYDLSFDVERGQITRVEFVADKPGLFTIVTPGRAPSMTAQLVVMPKP